MPMDDLRAHIEKMRKTVRAETIETIEFVLACWEADGLPVHGFLVGIDPNDMDRTTAGGALFDYGRYADLWPRRYGTHDMMYLDVLTAEVR